MDNKTPPISIQVTKEQLLDYAREYLIESPTAQDTYFRDLGLFHDFIVTGFDKGFSTKKNKQN